MKKYRVLLYRAKFGDASIMDNAISAWTGLINIPKLLWDDAFSFKAMVKLLLGRYAHVEIQTPDAQGRFSVQARSVGGDDLGLRFVGNCWTSTMRDDDNGTVCRAARTVLKHPERWEYMEFECEGEEYNLGIKYMKQEVKDNKGYSIKDCWGKFFLGGAVSDPYRNICSEFVHNACIIFGSLWALKFAVVSPLRLAYMLVKQHKRDFKPLETK